MKQFIGGERVKIIDSKHPLFNKTGIIARLRISDNGAWVNMDKNIPESLASFGKNDSRRNHILLEPWQCAEGKKI